MLTKKNTHCEEKHICLRRKTHTVKKNTYAYEENTHCEEKHICLRRKTHTVKKNTNCEEKKNTYAYEEKHTL